MAKPASKPTWATDANYPANTQPWASSATKVQPSSGKQAEGWEPEEPPPAQYMNWWKNLVGQWVDFVDDSFGSSQAVFLARQILSAASGTYTPTTGARKVR